MIMANPICILTIHIYIDIHGPDQTYAYNDMLVNGAAEQLQRRTEDLEVMRYGF
jgi:hypothetical protein